VKRKLTKVTDFVRYDQTPVYGKRVLFYHTGGVWPNNVQCAGELMAHVEPAKLTELVGELHKSGLLDLFDLEIRHSYQGCSHCLRLQLRNESTATYSVEAMVGLLYKLCGSVTFKTREEGFSITPKGYIKSRWLLDDGGC
jgi:hypothetical protein